MAKKTIDFKDPLWMTGWLDTALTKEKEKYAQCPIKPDAFPGHNEAQAWGYVVAGYFLVEESFKALLHLRGKTVRPKHSLTMLFDLLDDPNDQNLLREYYSDYRETLGWPRKFPFETLDAFLANLDGDPNHSGNDYIGSFDWRTTSSRRAEARSCQWSAWSSFTRLPTDVSAWPSTRTVATTSRLGIPIAGDCAKDVTGSAPIGSRCV